jgi:hypothetical protein
MIEGEVITENPVAFTTECIILKLEITGLSCRGWRIDYEMHRHWCNFLKKLPLMKLTIDSQYLSQHSAIIHHAAVV